MGQHGEELRNVVCRMSTALLLVCLPAAAAATGASSDSWRLRFLVEAGAEAMAARADSTAISTVVMAGVPGSAYLFDSEASGAPRRRAKLAVDPAAAHDAVMLADGSAVVAGRDGTVSRFAASAAGTQWRRELGERVASLAAGSGRVLASTWANRVWALDEKDGRVLWKAELGAKAEAPALVDGDHIYVATKGRTLVALDGARGLLRWKVDLPGTALHSPAISVGAPRLVYCGTWDGSLGAHDPATGRVRWSTRLPARLAGAPAAVPGGVVVATEDGFVRAFAEAAPKWETPGVAEGPTALVRQGTRVVAVSRRLVALDADTGTRVAEYPEGAREDLRRRFAQAMIEGEKTYTEAEKRALEEAEAFTIEGAVFGPARVSAAGIAFGTEDGWLYLFDATTLRARWRYRAAAASSASPAASGARVLTAAGSELMAIDSANGALAWRRDLGAEIESVLPAGDDVAVVAAGRLTFLRVADGTVAARPAGRLKTAASSAGGAWLTDDGRQVRLLVRGSDWSEVDTLDAGGETLPPVAHGDGWVMATKAGNLSGLAADTAAGGTGLRLVRRWTASAGETLANVRSAGHCLVLQTQAGPLVGFEPSTGQARWRRPLLPSAEWSTGGGDVLVYENGELLVLDPCTGARQLSHRVAAAPIISVRRGTDLVWLDARGRLHRVAAAPGAQPAQWDIGLSPSRAVLADGGFVVKTSTGETGFLEIAGW
jgi:outer membrane protein assembly factor BamB